MKIYVIIFKVALAITFRHTWQFIEPDATHFGAKILKTVNNNASGRSTSGYYKSFFVTLYASGRKDHNIVDPYWSVEGQQQTQFPPILWL